MADAKPRKGRGLALGTCVLALVWLCGVWPPPVWWRDHWPRATAMMREASPGGRVPTAPPVRLDDIPPMLQRMVIIGEDSRFWTHHGIDPAEIADALGLDRGRGLLATARDVWRRRDRLRGASTITQQLAKNLYLSPSRSPLRKLKEAATALRLEVALSKQRILELYLGVAEWGPGVWGIDAASRAYFGEPPARLDDAQAAALAATLPQPRSSNPVYHPDRMLGRRDLILARYYGRDVYIPPDSGEDTALVVPPVLVPPTESLEVTSPTVDSTEDTLKTRRTGARRDTVDSGRDSLP